MIEYVPDSFKTIVKSASGKKIISKVIKKQILEGKFMDTTNNQFQVLSVLLGLDQAECRHNMSNYESFMNSVEWKMSIRAFIAHLTNAEKNHLNKNH
ncbi:MAG: hypothetical protein WD735_02155, partial [Balneolaceae bacterium]